MTNHIGRFNILDKRAIERFLIESNQIEGIYEASGKEVTKAQWFLQCETLNIAVLCKLLSTIQPDALLRNKLGRNVSVLGTGIRQRYYPPKGGQKIGKELTLLLTEVSNYDIEPYETHLRYEKLHPFTDGNGRTGRLIWLWQMLGIEGTFPPYLHTFLRTFYFQTLAASRK